MYEFISIIWNKINNTFNNCVYKSYFENKGNGSLLLGLQLLYEEIESQKVDFSYSVNTNEMSKIIVAWLGVQENYISLTALKSQINRVMQRFEENNQVPEGHVRVVSNEILERNINCGQKLLISCSKPLLNDVLILGLKSLDAKIDSALNRVPEYISLESINRFELKNYIMHQIIEYPNFNLNEKIISDILIFSVAHFVDEVGILLIVDPIVIINNPLLVEEEVEVAGDVYD